MMSTDLILLVKSGVHWYDAPASVMVFWTDMEVYQASPDAYRASPTRNSTCHRRRVS
jgi:hypothetical protein